MKFSARAVTFSVLSIYLLQTTASADDSNSNPTTWYWRTGTPSTVARQVALGYRIVDLEVYSTSPFRLTALLVRNTGTYAQGWWWYYNINAATLRSKLTEHGARIVDIEAYMVGGSLLFSVVLTPNTGGNRKAWWYYYGATPSSISSRLSANGARLVDIDTYKVGASTRYAVVMIRNTGADSRAWWWYYGVSATTIRNRLSGNSARLMDIEHLGNNLYAVIMERSAARWYWYYGISSSRTMLGYASQNGARLFHIIPYIDTSGRRRWAGIMISNLNDVSETTFNYLATRRSGGSFGFYMRRINGPVYASLMSTTIYEPASSIKALHLAHAMRQVQQTDETLRDSIRVYTGYTGSCPLWSGPSSLSRLEQSLRRMMRASSNADTYAMIARYGEDAINLSAQQMGMSNTRLAHRIGCGSSSGSIIGQAEAPNQLTLSGITTLYSRAATTWLSGSARRRFFSIMSGYSAILTVVDEEAAKLSTLSTAAKTAFRRSVYARQKGGSYTVGPLRYRSIGAYVRLPFRSCSGAISNREYALGAFIDKSMSAIPSGTTSRAGAETMRGEINTALRSFLPCRSIALM